MSEDLKIFLVAIGAGLVGICSAVIFRYRHEADGNRSSKFNVHGWYASGILGFLLVCAVASDWGSIPELATILSFAVGLASLILALIAIIQTLTSSSNVDSVLATIKNGAESAADAGLKLASSVTEIRQAAGQAALAASSALSQIEQFGALSSQIIESNKAGENAIGLLRKEIEQKLPGTFLDKPNPANQQAEVNRFPKISLGGAATIYAAILAFEKKKALDLSEALQDKNTSFETGYISSMSDQALIDVDRTQPAVRTLDVHPDIIAMRDDLRVFKFSKPETAAIHEQRIAAVNRYFGE